MCSPEVFRCADQWFSGVLIGGEEFSDMQGCVPQVEGKLKELLCYGIGVNSDAMVVEDPPAEGEETPTIRRIGELCTRSLSAIVPCNNQPSRPKQVGCCFR